MAPLIHVFNLTGPTMLNVLYDTIDSLGLKLIHANSSRGTLIVSFAEDSADTVRIAVENKNGEAKTQVQFISDLDQSTAIGLEKMFFDKVNTIIRQSKLAK